MKTFWFDQLLGQYPYGWKWSVLQERLHDALQSVFQSVLGEGGGICNSLAGPLAQIRNWKRLGDGLHRRGSRLDMEELLPYAIGLVLIGLAIWAAAVWKKRNDMSLPSDDPCKLFRELCNLHGIKGSNRRLLQRLAEVQKMEQPSELFVTPTALDPMQLPEQFQSPLLQQQLRDLRVRLFG
jgi:hypothetical protein